MIEVDRYNIADTVLLRVNEVYCSSVYVLKDVIKYTPSDAAKRLGHSFYPTMHKYALEKGSPQRGVIVYTPKLGVIKEIKKPKEDRKINTWGEQKYLIQWQNRSDDELINISKSYQYDEFYHGNLIAFKDIEKLMTQEEFIEYAIDYAKEYNYERDMQIKKGR